MGFGLWRRGGVAFAVEFIFYAAVAVIVLPSVFVGSALLLGGVFHFANSNSFFGFTMRNPMGGSSNVYATFDLLGFVLFILLVSALIWRTRAEKEGNAVISHILRETGLEADVFQIVKAVLWAE